MKTPKFVSKLAAVLTPRPRKKLQATARAVPRAAMDDYDSDEPTTKLSSAFVVVFILHVVAIGGIYAFDSIKTARAGKESLATAAEKPKPAAAASAKAPTQNAAAAARVTENTPVAAPVPKVSVAKPGAPQQYTVKAGDNPTKIAFAYEIKADELLAANNLKAGAVLQVGQTLAIPAPKPAAKPAIAETQKPEVAAKQIDVPPTRTTPGLRFVKKGDTVSSIAKIYGLTVEQLLKFNKLTDPKKLQLGQALKIPPKKG